MIYNFNLLILIRSWTVPIVVAGLVFGLTQPVFAQIVAKEVDLAQAVAVGNIEVGSETVDGYQQVYYIFKGTKTFVTHENQNSYQPVSSGEYITWITTIDGAGQIFLYHIPSDTTAQITHTSTNLKPRVSSGKVVWERWVGDRWQIFLFDGQAVRQLTSGDVSVNADIEGGQVVYARQDTQGSWREIKYIISTGESAEVKKGLEAKHPRAMPAQNPPPLPTQPQTVTREEVKKGLE